MASSPGRLGSPRRRGPNVRTPASKHRTSSSAAGPYDQWPCQRGFDRYYGFLDGETDQFHPQLIYDNHAIEPPSTPEDGYHLSEDLVDPVGEQIVT
jgi:arylsulfatase A-like enzyme